jgi:hypothetical protein
VVRVGSCGAWMTKGTVAAPNRGVGGYLGPKSGQECDI